MADTKNPTLKVALVGDSMAGNWWAPLEQIATREHWELVTELHATCAWTSTQMYDGQNKGAYPACYQWGVSVLHDLVATVRPDVVITSEVFSAGSLAHPVDSSQSRADVGAGEATYWKDLQAHGIGVVAIKETPITAGVNPPACVAKLGPDAKRCAVPISQALPADPPTSYADRDAGGTVPVIDMNSLICGPTSCPSVVGNVLVYMDSHHLTQPYAQTLTPYLRDKLSGALAKVLPPAKQAAIP